MSTPHNNASVDQIAKTVLMPGDPLRSQYIAETLLTDPVLVNDVRGIHGYTGMYNGRRVTVMASGMGMPSIGIYSYELFKFYDVKNIIRIGSAGALRPDLKLFDVLLSKGAYSESSFARIQSGDTDIMQYPSEALNEVILSSAEKLNVPVTVANIYSSDVFYHDSTAYKEEMLKHDCAAVEMESFALFHNAKVLHKNAACLLTISDSPYVKQQTTPEERQTSFTNMMKIALETAWREDE